ncbi:MAG: hypothetical protein AB1762_06085 [Gemmatimonadota bacterium]
MSTEPIINATETVDLFRRRVIDSDAEWFDKTCTELGLRSTGLFRRMRLAFEATRQQAQSPVAPEQPVSP